VAKPQTRKWHFGESFSLLKHFYDIFLVIASHAAHSSSASPTPWAAPFAVRLIAAFTSTPDPRLVSPQPKLAEPVIFILFNIFKGIHFPNPVPRDVRLEHVRRSDLAPAAPYGHHPWPKFDQRLTNYTNKIKNQFVFSHSEMIRRVLALDDQVLTIARQIYKEKSVLVMGRGYNFATCMEGALKIKELSYMHCEGPFLGLASQNASFCPNPIKTNTNRIFQAFSAENSNTARWPWWTRANALLWSFATTMSTRLTRAQSFKYLLLCLFSNYQRSLNAMQQVMARGGRPIIIADESVPAADLAEAMYILRVPKTVDCLQNILSVIPLQLLAYHVADLNGFNVNHTDYT
jgi:hypothetical protein